jgi:peptide-methionine (R)-S-oxide reductase
MNIGSIPHTDEEWKQKLTDEQYQVMRKGDVELPYTGRYLITKAKGIYVCAGCGTSLFSSQTKFDYGSGWPSFGEPLNIDVLKLSLGVFEGKECKEARCSTCKSHLGYVFEDGPLLKGKGVRYCINSCALSFIKDKDSDNKRKK